MLGNQRQPGQPGQQDQQDQPGQQHKNAESEFARSEARERQRRVALFDDLATERDRWKKKNQYYYDSITRLVKFVVPEDASVLEIGCGTGDLLASLRPRAGQGTGIDMSPKQVEIARAKHPHLTFLVGDGESLDLAALHHRAFDYVVMANTVGYVADVWALFRALQAVCHPRTRVFISYYNFVWEPVLRLGSKLGLRMPVPQANWLGMEDLANLLHLNHFEVVKQGTAMLLPKRVPLLAPLLNTYLADAPGLRHLALTQFFVARPLAGGKEAAQVARGEYSCSVIVPCRNERGNIDDIVSRTPVMGSGTELLFVDGNSEDGTVEAIRQAMAQHAEAKAAPGLARSASDAQGAQAAGGPPGATPGLTLRLLLQGDGKGKGDAVRKGFAAATGDMLFILDADLTVPPEDLPKFYAVIAEGKGEFVNGSRLVYPMEGEAMRLLNLFGNRFFGWALSSILGQRLKDTLCGTKVLLSRDYEQVKKAREFLGDFDPFGDFDLLFGAAKANLKIVEMPIRYRARTYGETKISRFSHGWLLARMTAHAFRKFRMFA